MSSTLYKAPVNPDQRVLLFSRQARIKADGVLDPATVGVPGFGVKQAGLCEHRLGGDVQRLRDVLEDLSRGLVQPALELTQIRVGDFRNLSQLAQRQVRELALRLDEFAQAFPVFVGVAHAYAIISFSGAVSRGPASPALSRSPSFCFSP